ncbi:MAG: GNAT family N-acetyltransferase [Chloroflexi bacterium]|nr:GNAT family N-acetyltransferase [Chloroflexota bacterium]
MPQRTVRPAEIVVARARVALRPFRGADIDAVEPWYVAAAAVGHGVRPEDVPSIRRPKSVGRGRSLDRGRAGALPYGVVPYDAEADPDRALLAVILGDADAPIGLLDYRLGRPSSGWCTVGFVALEPGRRGYGLGSEAVRAFEEAVRERGLADRFRAGVHRENGLGFYFWLRLGYRPAASGDFGDAEPAADRDTMWMVRS